MDVLRQMLGVAMVFGLFGAALFWLRRKGALQVRGMMAGTRGREIETVERLVLTPGYSLHLVRWGDQTLLIAAGAGACTVLESRPWKPAAKVDR